MKVESPFHTNFKLQEKSFKSVTELIDFSRSILPEINSFLNKWFDTNSYVEVKTSGSTGKPKVIQLQKKHMVNSAIATGKFFKLHENTTALLCMSPNFIAGKMMLVRAMVLGWHLDVVKPISNPLNKCDKHYDFSAMVPLQLLNSLGDLHKVKKLIVGGGAVSNELLGKIQNSNTEVFETYGMTETITHIAAKKLNNFKNSIASEVTESFGFVQDKADQSKMRQSYYQLLPNVTISTNQRGCLVIDAPEVSEELVVTNDLVEIISSTEFKWLGRVDNVINSGGVKLIPELIEQKLAKIIHQRFFVIGRQDNSLGEKLVLIIEGIKNDVVLKAVQQTNILSKYEIPKEIYFMEKFMETPTKKVNRKETFNSIIKTC